MPLLLATVVCLNAKLYPLIPFSSKPGQLQVKNMPPRDPWIFRSVLDGRARVVTLALAKGFWVSFDATNCGLHKFWKGDVNFEGSVYNSVHGPQPSSKGGSIEDGLLDKPVWTLRSPEQGAILKPRFRGYRIHPTDKNIATLQYDFEVMGKSVRVEETPSLIWEGGKAIGLQRAFKRVGAIGSGEALSVIFKKSGGAAKNHKAMGGTVDIDAGGNQVFTFEGETGSVSTFFDPILSESAPSFAEFSNEVFASIGSPEVAASIAMNLQQQDVREAGLALRVYLLENPLEKIPTLVPNQSPNVSKKISTVSLKNEADFGAKERFYATITGWLKAQEGGLYQFRIGSDDGSRLLIKDERIIDQDGLHSGEFASGSIDIEEGSVPIKIEYFQNSVDASLVLQWKKPGDDEWATIPAEAFETVANDVKVTAPGFKKVMDSLWPFRAGDGRPETSVHPSFDLSTPRPEGFSPRVGGIDFLPDGRLVLCTWDPEGAVYALSGVQSGDPKKVTMKKIASGLAEPLGIKVVNGSIYVLQKQELTKLNDLNGDGVMDEYYAVANGWGVTNNFHEFAFGLQYKDGFFYGNLATAIDPGGKSSSGQNKDRGRTIQIDAKTGEFKFIASGLRTPNGVGMNSKGELFITDNQGDWLPSCKLMELIPGAFYGNRSVDPVGTKDLKDTPPVCWFPQGEIGNSTSQPAPFEYGPYKGQMIVGDVTHGGLKRIQMEKVNGRYQGTVFRMTQGLEAGINRVIVGPDKAIYVGGIGSTGNWGQEGKERFGLQRLAYNGKTTFEMLAFKPMKNGVEIEFTEPLAAGQPLVKSDFVLSTWQYVPTGEYGGPKLNVKAPGLKSVTLSAGNRKMFLEFDGLVGDRVVYVKLPTELKGVDGQLLWSTEAWSTVNTVPNRMGVVNASPIQNDRTELSATEKAEGFAMLFDGKSMEAWRGYRKESTPKGWLISDGNLTYIPGIGGGDLTTKEQFGDFDLRLEWKIQPGGNSGIMYRSRETRGAPYETAIEMQVLDDAKHGDGKNPLTSAGSSYGLYAPTKKVVNPANNWNHARIVAKGGKVEHWLNGVMVVSFDTNSEEFKTKIKNSKFKDWPEFAKYGSGHIVLQDHGDLVAYRNIRIKKL